MNYYEHHIGDYAEATAHLSFVEDAAYSRLIRKYYATEKPIPADLKAAQRLVAARTRDEREAVQRVLEEFFELTEDGWHHHRCDREIASYRAGQPQREAKKRNEDVRLERHRAARAALFAVINDAGMHMPWNCPTAELRAAVERIQAEQPATRPATPATAPATTEAQPATGTATPPATAPATPATATHTRAPLPTSHSPLPTPHPPTITDDGDTSPGGAVPRCPVEQIVAIYHEVLPDLPRVKLMSDDRREGMRKLWKFALTEPKSDGKPRATNAEEALSWVRGYFERARDNDWLMGRTQRTNGHQGWECDLDFLLSKKGMKHVIEKTREQHH